jgi:hypothetical protein
MYPFLLLFHPNLLYGICQDDATQIKMSAIVQKYTIYLQITLRLLACFCGKLQTFLALLTKVARWYNMKKAQFDCAISLADEKGREGFV